MMNKLYQSTDEGDCWQCLTCGKTLKQHHCPTNQPIANEQVTELLGLLLLVAECQYDDERKIREVPAIAKVLSAHYPDSIPKPPRDFNSSHYRGLYYQLLYEVLSKFPNESRHQTALRYIREAESRVPVWEVSEHYESTPNSLQSGDF